MKKYPPVQSILVKGEAQPNNTYTATSTKRHKNLSVVPSASKTARYGGHLVNPVARLELLSPGGKFGIISGSGRRGGAHPNLSKSVNEAFLKETS